MSHVTLTPLSRSKGQLAGGGDIVAASRTACSIIVTLNRIRLGTIVSLFLFFLTNRICFCVFGFNYYYFRIF